jgi:hypothetical protein
MQIQTLVAALVFSLGTGVMPTALSGQIPAGAGVAPAHAPVAQNDTLPSIWNRPRLQPVSGILPAIAAGAVLGAVARSVRPDCVLPSSHGQSAAIGALWGGLQQKSGSWKRQTDPTRTHADHPHLEQERSALNELCGERISTGADHQFR